MVVVALCTKYWPLRHFIVRKTIASDIYINAIGCTFMHGARKYLLYFVILFIVQMCLCQCLVHCCPAIPFIHSRCEIRSFAFAIEFISSPNVRWATGTMRTTANVNLQNKMQTEMNCRSLDRNYSRQTETKASAREWIKIIL